MSRFYPFVLLFAVLVSACNQPDDNDPYLTTPYVLQIPQGLPPMDAFIPLNNPMTVEGVALGRKLFYDPILSGDNTQACAHCHKQEFGFGDPRQFSEGIDGSIGTRQAMSIINLGWNQFGFFWDGREATLEDQALKPVTNPVEMNTTWPEVEAKLNADATYKLLFKQAYNVDYIDSLTVAKAIAQFERILISGNSKFDKWYNQQSIQLSESELRGFILYNGEGADCFHCHGLGGLITDNRFHNNGMDTDFSADEGRYLVTGNDADKGKFRTPTLRNIEFTAPYMHDGRFQTIEQVVDHYSQHILPSATIDPLMELVGNGGAQLTQQDKDDLIAFLKTFTDEGFLTNPEFSNPNP
ncbi:MAG: cytochrome-c peroxidase [Flavobacteriales bacterium]|nr:cytochrome-c peroxidase [Flavobacteriales bacterium]